MKILNETIKNNELKENDSIEYSKNLMGLNWGEETEREFEKGRTQKATVTRIKNFKDINGNARQGIVLDNEDIITTAPYN